MGTANNIAHLQNWVDLSLKQRTLYNSGSPLVAVWRAFGAARLETSHPPHEQNKHMNMTIRFDGGTPCNIPRLGYGIGYGSYQINQDPVVKVNHGIPMSNNAAEMYTLIEAVRSIHNPETVDLVIMGDSRIGLRWAQITADQVFRHGSPKSSPLFLQAIATLHQLMPKFRSVETKWTPRLESVAVFGH